MSLRLAAAIGLGIIGFAPAGHTAGLTPRVLPPKGYVLLEGDEARLARTGNLFRIAVRELTRKDGTKTTVYRDVDYPIRETRDATNSPAKAASAEAPPDQPADDDGETTKTETAPSAPSEPASQVWAYLGPEYEDPPPPGASPSPNRLHRPGPSSVIYEFDAYALTGGIRDEYLRLEFDFSGTHPRVRSGHWSMENEAGDTTPTPPPGWDFKCEQGAYGEAFGKIETANLHAGAPDEIVVTLVRKIDERQKNAPEDEPRPVEGTGRYRLKRKRLG